MCLHNKIFIETLKDRVGSFWVVETSACWEGVHWRGYGSSALLSPMHCPMHGFHCLFLSCLLYYKPVIVSKVLSWVLWFILVNYWLWGGPWQSQICSQSGRDVGLLGTPFAAGVWIGTVCELQPSTCGVWTRSGQLLSELNWIKL